MNIFYLSNHPLTCAAEHVNRHCVKMIIEYAQLLSTAHRVLDGKESVVLSKTGRKTKAYRLKEPDLESQLYKATHINHPSAVWVRESRLNYIWLANLLFALCQEYTYRYGKVHKVERDGLSTVLLTNVPKNIPNKPFTQPTPAMPDEYKVPGDSIQSYKNYYNGAKSRMFAWKNRPTPNWIKVS